MHRYRLLNTRPFWISILTFNIWALPDVGFKVLSPFRAERVAKICQELRTFSVQANAWDTVLLQEVWTSEDRRTLKNCGYSFNIDQEDASRFIDSGLLILSKHPLQNSARLTFSTSGDSSRVFEDGEAYARKSALIAKVAHPDHPYWIANTHLISYYSEGTDNYAETRRQQFSQFVQWAKATAGRQPLILGGDFNFHSNMPHWQDLIHLLPDFKQAPGHQTACTICPPNMMHTQNEGKVDHLLGSSNFHAVSGQIRMDTPFEVEGLQINLSDHFAWKTVFTFP